jgi:5-methylthioadenosine/S-adenosylhomocysteine deaminase
MRDGAPSSVPGAVWIDDDGLIAAVTPLDAEPGGFAGTPRVAAGGVIYPGLIDLHNHLLYNTLPLWTEPTRTTPWTSHAQWPRQAPSYQANINDPAELLGKAAGAGAAALCGDPRDHRRHHRHPRPPQRHPPARR